MGVWYSGGYLYPIGWIPGIIFIVLGSFIGSIVFAAAGVIGSDLGIPSMVTVRGSFGIRGSQFMSILNYITLIGWTAWMLYINASAADQICRILFNYENSILWIVIAGILCTTIALFKAEGWVIFTRISVISLVLITIAINYLVFSNYGWDYLASKPSWGLPWTIAFDLTLIMPLSWAPLAADYMRFAKNSKGAFIGSFIGQAGTNSWFYITGLACALAFATYDPTVYVTQIGGLIFGIMSLFVIWLGTITTTFLDIYSANMSLINIFPKMKEWQGSIITGVLGTIIAFLPWLEVFVHFLYIIGAVFIPLFAIVLADYFLIRRRKYIVKELYIRGGIYWYKSGINVFSIIIWLLGTIIYFITYLLFPDVGATLPSFLITFLIYYLIGRTIYKNVHIKS
ncbi:MAG: cytosine permease [Candidatus Methanomethyliaceae archaeon]|nr:cytosine permease [Candidatus Methanomethyliaceae archaeon]MDW7971437.1 cytosine permease [Nitrososphaerota archaeon]